MQKTKNKTKQKSPKTKTKKQNKTKANKLNTNWHLLQNDQNANTTLLHSHDKVHTTCINRFGHSLQVSIQPRKLKTCIQLSLSLKIGSFNPNT